MPKFTETALRPVLEQLYGDLGGDAACSTDYNGSTVAAFIGEAQADPELASSSAYAFIASRRKR